MIDLIRKIESFMQVTETGYAEHFIGGIIIAAIVSYFVFKKTDAIWTAIFLGVATAVFLGLVKELIDPYMRGDRNKLDFIFTCLGGAIGALSFFLFRKLFK